MGKTAGSHVAPHRSLRAERGEAACAKLFRVAPFSIPRAAPTATMSVAQPLRFLRFKGASEGLPIVDTVYTAPPDSADPAKTVAEIMQLVAVKSAQPHAAVQLLCRLPGSGDSGPTAVTPSVLASMLAAGICPLEQEENKYVILYSLQQQHTPGAQVRATGPPLVCGANRLTGTAAVHWHAPATDTSPSLPLRKHHCAPPHSCRPTGHTMQQHGHQWRAHQLPHQRRRERHNARGAHKAGGLRQGHLCTDRRHGCAPLAELCC